MRLPNAAPGEGGRVDYEHFANWCIAAGQKHNAYIAGPCQWFVAHPSDRGTKPCLHWMTKKELPCRFCAMNKTPQEIGYQPVWREVDWRPMLVILYATEREHVERMELHERVVIGREVEIGARLWVRRCSNQEPRFTSSIPRRMVAQDITRCLLTIWKLPELTAWLQTRGASDKGMSLPAPAAPTPAAADVYTAPTADDVHDEYAAVLNRVKEHAAKLPGRNGKPAPKG